MPKAARSLSERAAALVEQLFDAPGGTATWQRFLTALCNDLGEHVVALLLGRLSAGGPTIALGHGVDLQRINLEDVRPGDRQPGPDALPIGKVFPIQPADLGFARSAVFQRIFTKLGLPPGPGCYVPLTRNPHISSGLVVLSHDQRWRLRDEDRALLEVLAPYIVLAGRAGRQLNAEQSRAAALLHAFGQLRLGVILLDEANRVTFANESAIALLGLPRGEAQSAGESSRRLTAALAALLRTESGTSHHALRYPRPGDGRPLQILGTPLRWDEDDGGARSRFVTALFVSDPEDPTPESARTLRELYGLSPAEAALVRELTAGATLAEAAERLGIRPSTARGALKAVFAKTGTRRQASVVRLAVSGVAQVRTNPREARS